VAGGVTILAPPKPPAWINGVPMPAERSASGPSSAGFSATWCATDLGGYRACRYTYERYPYQSDLTASGLTLPQDFVTFQTSSNLYGLLDKVVGDRWLDRYLRAAAQSG
jgi:hypothetical protein